MPDVIHPQYVLGFEAGVDAALEILREEFPGLDEPEFGGPVSAVEDMKTTTLDVFRSANERKVA